MKTVMVAIAIIFATSCASVLPVIRTIVDIASILCEQAASEQPKEFLKGQTPQAFCKHERNLQPFIDELLKAKAAAKGTAGMAR